MNYILNTIKSFLFLTLLVSSFAFATGGTGTDPNLAVAADGAGYRTPKGDCGLCVGASYIDSSQNQSATPGASQNSTTPGSGDVKK